MSQEIVNSMCEIVGSDNVKLNESMNRHTTFQVGGPVDYYLIPHTIDEIKELILLCRNEHIPFYVIGNGSNLLVRDSGWKGAVIQIYKNFCGYEINGETVKAQAGILLSKLAKRIYEQSLTGFEFASGIPGTLGGAVAMNAGAYGGEMKHILDRAVIMDQEGQIKTLTNEELNLGYRTSIVSEEKYIVLEAELKLAKGEKEEIKSKMDDFTNRRITKQPLEFPSAGSTFKRPEGYFAGKLIMDSGLAGYSIGGAKVSEKHCGFVINSGNATASDILNLIEYIREQVYKNFQVLLVPEVKILG